VDTLLVLDLVRLAQQRAFDTALILAVTASRRSTRVVADDYARRVILYSVEGSTPAKELVQSPTTTDYRRSLASSVGRATCCRGQ